MKISLKRIKCILTGGCRFRDSAISECDERKDLYHYGNLLQMREEIYSRIYLQTIRDSRLR